MKITIEPTQDWDGNTPPPKVSVEIADDDLTLDVIVQAMIVPALMGYGFSEELVNKRLYCEHHE